VNQQRCITVSLFTKFRISQLTVPSQSLVRRQRGVTYPNVRELVNCRYKHCSFRAGARDADIRPRRQNSPPTILVL